MAKLRQNLTQNTLKFILGKEKNGAVKSSKIILLIFKPIFSKKRILDSYQNCIDYHNIIVYLDNYEICCHFLSRKYTFLSK